NQDLFPSRTEVSNGGRGASAGPRATSQTRADPSDEDSLLTEAAVSKVVPPGPNATRETSPAWGRGWPRNDPERPRELTGVKAVIGRLWPTVRSASSSSRRVPERSKNRAIRSS